MSTCFWLQLTILFSGRSRILSYLYFISDLLRQPACFFPLLKISNPFQRRFCHKFLSIYTTTFFISVTILEFYVTFFTQLILVFSDNLCYSIDEQRKYQRKPPAGGCPEQEMRILRKRNWKGVVPPKQLWAV